MKAKVAQIEVLKLTGRSTLHAWEQGLIGELMVGGLPLSEAQDVAFLEGALVHENIVHNLITTVGLRIVGDWAIDADATGLTFHEIGTNANVPTVADIALTVPVARKVWTQRARAGNVVTLSVFYTAAESTYSIEEAGIWGGVLATSTIGTGTLFAHYLEIYDNSAGLVDLTFDYVLTPS